MSDDNIYKVFDAMIAAANEQERTGQDIVQIRCPDCDELMTVSGMRKAMTVRCVNCGFHFSSLA